MFENKKITVVGSGISGIAAAKLLLHKNAIVTLYDGNEALDKEKVLEIYKNEGYIDKYNVLQYREDNTVNYNSCDGYIDYMYGYMLPSTGYIKDYVIKLHHPGFIVQYPRAEFNGDIPRFEDDPSFGKMIQKARDWKELCGVDNISSMNSFTNTKEYIQFINMCETKHNDMLAEIGNIVKTNINGTRIYKVTLLKP